MVHDLLKQNRVPNKHEIDGILLCFKQNITSSMCTYFHKYMFVVLSKSGTQSEL